MTEYADIHNHILFGLDDGAKSLDESMELIHLAYQNGTRNIIFTPHYHRGRWTKSKKIITETASVLKGECEKKYSDLKLSLGCEIYYTSDIPDLLENRKLMTMAESRYILLEFSPVSEYRLIQTGIREVMQKGFLPIIAHVERYHCIRQDKRLIEELIQAGAYIQVNADSISGKYGWSVKRFCKYLLKNEFVHFVASDSHDLKQRKPVLKPCADYISKKYGEDYAQRLLYRNALKIQKNQIIK